MKLIDFLFESAREIQNGDLDEFNQLHQRAKHDTERYTTTDKGFKGLYARLNKGWLFQLALIFALPFFQTWLLSYKNRILNGGTSGSSELDFDDHEDNYDDDDEREYFEHLKRKYE